MPSPLASTSYASLVSQAVCLMLSSSANFQAWTGTNSSATALSWIVEDDGGVGQCYATNNAELDPAAGNWAAVRMGEPKRVQRAFLTWGWGGDGEIQLVEHITAGDKPPEVIRRARNNAGLIGQDMQALFGSTGALVAGEIDVGKSVIQDLTKSLANCVITPIHLTWRDLS